VALVGNFVKRGKCSESFIRNTHQNMRLLDYIILTIIYII
jgi:hypothetical protein